MKLSFTSKQLVITSFAAITSNLVAIGVFAGKGTFGSATAQNLE
jgi:hypothetical protein